MWCMRVLCILFVKCEGSVPVCVLCMSGVPMVYVSYGCAIQVVCRFLVYVCCVCDVLVLWPQSTCCVWCVCSVCAACMW